MKWFEHLPDIPITWAITSLGDISTLVQYGLTATADNDSRGVLFLRISDIDDDGRAHLKEPKYISESIADIDKYRLIPGDVVIARSGSVGRSLVYKGSERPWVFASYLIRFRLDQELVDPDYLGFYLRSPYYWQQIENFHHTVAQPNINSRELSAITVPLPPLSEQRRIVTILRQADMLRKWREDACIKHTKLLSSLFYNLFGNPLDDTNRWGFKPIRQMGTVTTGNTPPRERKEYYGDFIEWIKTDNISDEQIFVSKSKESLSDLGMSVGRTVLPGSVLIACIAGSIESIGRVALTDRKVAFNQQINAITPFDTTNPFYLYAVIKLSRSRIQANSKKALKEIVSKSTLEEILMLYPPKNLQDDFEKQFLELTRIKDLSLKSKESLSKLFLSLSNGVFTGNLTASWHEKHKEELQRAAVERDKKLGVRGEVPTFKDVEEGRLTPEEEEQIRQGLSQALGQFAVNVTKLTEPIRQGPLVEMSQNIFEPIIQSLRQSQQPVFSVQLPLINPSISTESVLRYIDNLPVPQEKRSIIETLDTIMLRVLKLAGTYPAYFTARDLEAGELGGITTLQAETSLRTLQALGFVKLVQMDGLLNYRLIDENDYADLPSSLSVQS